MEAFSTEQKINPPFCPVQCPCYNAFCSLLTKCSTCYWRDSCSECEDIIKPPGSNKPYIELWLKWMKYRDTSVQPDLMLCVRPYLSDIAADADGRELVGKAVRSISDVM